MCHLKNKQTNTGNKYSEDRLTQIILMHFHLTWFFSLKSSAIPPIQDLIDSLWSFCPKRKTSGNCIPFDVSIFSKMRCVKDKGKYKF